MLKLKYIIWFKKVSLTFVIFPSVAFSIKSFKVPELYIDVPETATVASLKVCVFVYPGLVIIRRVIPMHM